MKHIDLSQGKIAVVDDEDYEYLSRFKWYAWRNKKTWYAVRNINLPNGKRSIIKMHRVILNAPHSSQVDHKDNDGLNNQRNNLRLCVNAENCRNRRKRHKDVNTSGYKGVCLKVYKSGYKVWIAQIMGDDCKVHLGCFKTERQAAVAYNRAAKKLHGKFANLNKTL